MIYKSIDGLKDASSLSKTTRKLYQSFKVHFDEICRSVLTQEVDCFKEAQKLLNALEDKERDESLTVSRIKQHYDRAKMAHLFFGKYQEDSIRKTEKNYRGYVFTPSEREVIIRAYYTVCIFMVGESRRETRESVRRSLYQLTLLELKQIEWVVIVVVDMLGDWDLNDNGKLSPNLDLTISNLQNWSHAEAVLWAMRLDMKQAAKEHTILEAERHERLLEAYARPRRTGTAVKVEEIIPDWSDVAFRSLTSADTPPSPCHTWREFMDSAREVEARSRIPYF